jgi:hypothetical protein
MSRGRTGVRGGWVGCDDLDGEVALGKLHLEGLAGGDGFGLGD